MKPEFTFGSWYISIYFLIISLDFSLLFYWVKRRARTKGLSENVALDVGFIGAISGLIGARLFHVLYEYPEYYFNNPQLIFHFWQGGFVILPGLFFGFILGLMYLNWKKQTLSVWLDLFAPVIALGYVIGRWACFFQGCCYGKVTDSFLGVVFPVLQQQGLINRPRIPTQILTSVGEFAVLLFLIYVEKKYKNLKPGIIFVIWVVGHSINRILMEFLRDDPRGPLLFNWGISFWLSVLVIFPALVYGFRKST